METFDTPQQLGVAFLPHHHAALPAFQAQLPRGARIEIMRDHEALPEVLEVYRRGEGQLGSSAVWFDGAGFHVDDWQRCTATTVATMQAALDMALDQITRP